MRRRYNLAHSILVSVVVLVLTLLMVNVDAQAQIAFQSDRDGHLRKDIPGILAPEIYVMDADGGICENSPITPIEIVLPHGHPMVDGLPSCL